MEEIKNNQLELKQINSKNYGRKAFNFIVGFLTLPAFIYLFSLLGPDSFRFSTSFPEVNIFLDVIIIFCLSLVFIFFIVVVMKTEKKFFAWGLVAPIILYFIYILLAAGACIFGIGR